MLNLRDNISLLIIALRKSSESENHDSSSDSSLKMKGCADVFFISLGTTGGGTLFF